MCKVLYIPYVKHGYNAARVDPVFPFNPLVSWRANDIWNGFQPLNFLDACVDVFGFIWIS